jgi:hypothetical protein
MMNCTLMEAISMALTRVKTGNMTIPEVAEAQVVLLGAMGSDGKPYLVAIDEGTGQLPVTTSGVTTVTIKETKYHNYAVQGATTLAWLQLIASTSAVISDWDVTDTSGQVLELGVGAAGAEARFALIPAGGGSPFEHRLPAGSRVSIKAVDADASTGKLVINAWG